MVGHVRKLRLVAAPSGDVLDLGEEVGGLAALVADERGVDRDPDGVPGGVQVALLDVVDAHLAGAHRAAARLSARRSSGWVSSLAKGSASSCCCS